MTASATVIDHVREIAQVRLPAKQSREAGAEPPIQVRFASGVAGRLDPAKARDRVWAEVLESRRKARQPAYVEIDPDTGFITSLLLPRQFIVTGRRETENNDLEIEVEISQARHFLRRGIPGFERMREVIERALRDRSPVLLTESLDSSAIVDVRPASASRAGHQR